MARYRKRSKRYSKKRPYKKRSRYRLSFQKRKGSGYRGKGRARLSVAPERKEFNASSAATSDFPGTPIGRISVISMTPLNVVSGSYYLGYSPTSGIQGFFPNIARGTDHFTRIGREVIFTGMDLKLRFTQQRACVNPMKVRVVIFRDKNQQLKNDYNYLRLFDLNFLEFPWVTDSTCRYDYDERKKMQILHDMKYTIKGDTTPTSLVSGSTGATFDVTEDKRQWNYKDIHIKKSMFLRVRYDDDDEQVGPPLVRDVNTNWAIAVFADTGNCSGLPYTLQSPHQMPAASGLHMTWSVKWNWIDP